MVLRLSTYENEQPIIRFCLRQKVENVDHPMQILNVVARNYLRHIKHCFTLSILKTGLAQTLFLLRSSLKE